MTNMAQIQTVMFEPVTAKTKNLPSLIKQERPKRECRARKRPYDIELYATKRLKYDQIDNSDEQIDSSCAFGLTTSDTDDDNDTESKCSTSDDTEQSLIKHHDDNSDIEDVEDETANVYFSKISSDQNRHFPVVFKQSIVQQQQTFSRHSKRLISHFKYLYDHGLRKSIQPTNSPENFDNQNNDIYLEKLRWELRNTFNRIDLFKEGYCVLSNEPFPFYSLCYMCGSLGSELIYCTSCCEAYHSTCLNEYERPRLDSVSESWLCPNCNVCNICGLLTHQNFLSRMITETNFSPQLISCFDCKRNFHIKCIKRLKDDQLNELNNLNVNNVNNNSIVSLSRLSNSYLLNQTWFCPSCIKCDCGQALISNERNILSLTKTFTSQQSLMCFDCFNNIKLIRLEKNDNIDKCHLCEKYIEQIYSKQKQQQQQQVTYFLQCMKCQHRFHPKCDGYLNEDATIIPHVKDLCLNIICSKCDVDERAKLRKYLLEYKLQAIETILSSISTILQLVISEENDFNKLQSYVTNLRQLHESRHQSLNLHTFLNDLLVLIRGLLTKNDIQRWQSVIDGCIIRQCPWFKSSSFLSNHKIIHHSTPTINHYSQPPPSVDHSYAQNTEHILNETSSDSLLAYLDKDLSNREEADFTNLHEIDKRKCHICETLSDHPSSNIGRLISFGVNQWVHVGCILPAYAKNLDQPPFILRNIRETVLRCQTKYLCAICSKLGASVHCCENECYQRFHCECIQKYYSTVDKSIQQQLNIKNGFLPNLTTLCLKHNGLKTMNHVQRESLDGTNEDEAKESMNTNNLNHPKLKSVDLSSAVYGDLSNNLVELTLFNTRLCIGSLQIESLGNFDYQIDKTNDDELFSNKNYPNNYRASRLFWSLKNPRHKTVYHLHIEIDQPYHQDLSNHKVLAHPLTIEQAHLEQLYDTCRKYFEKFQKKIDDHLNSIEEFCQKTTINKKGIPNQSNYKKKATNIGIGTTKRLTKGTPSCVKRQTPKAALKNVSRPRNRFANDKQSQLPLTTKQTMIKDNQDFRINDIQNLFNNEYLKTTNMSQIALALVQALRHVEQSTKIQQETNPSYYLSNQMSNSPNGAIMERHNDMLLKQLLRNIAAPQQLNDSRLPTMNSSQSSSYTSQWRSTISTQTETSSASQSYTDIKTNNILQHSFSSFTGSLSLPHTTDNSPNLLTKPTRIPQVDGSIDDDADADDEDLSISSLVINSLIEQIISKNDSERLRTDSEYSIDLSDYVNSPSLINFTPISPTHRPRLSANFEKEKSLSSFDIIQLYKQWSKLNFFRVKFTITNDEGYELISDDLDSAWSKIIDSIRNCRDDMNLPHLPMTNEELNGHKIFGLTKPVVKTMLNQMYTNEQPIGNILLSLSSSSLLNNGSPSCLTDIHNKKTCQSSCSRTNIYERKTRERQRFGWLLNQSRKIEYALKSFDIDDALAHARQILLAEASVSLRLYHLHYFSERALLVGSSPIHGCGLFTLVDLVEGQMIIEYAGEVVRPCLTDKRERENEGKGFGCYMFTIDSMNVIDATHRGNKARFINHNCEPNCFAKTVLSGGAKHIVIYALIDIARGSELTYDYSFPEEDVKIPCHCGTSKCRIYLN